MKYGFPGPLAQHLVCIAALALLLSCGDRTGVDPDSGPPPVEGEDSGSAQDTAAEPDAGPDGGPETGDALVEPEMAQEWIEAPPGLCDNPSNLAKALWVKDGDTIEIDWPSPDDPYENAAVRYIGVAAPETSGGGECFAYEAKDHVAKMTPKYSTVCLQKEVAGSSTVDPYGRLLRWVFYQLPDGRWVLQNHRLVRLGSAKAYHSFLKGRIYEEVMEEAEKLAKSEKLGGWTECGWY